MRLLRAKSIGGTSGASLGWKLAILPVSAALGLLFVALWGGGHPAMSSALSKVMLAALKSPADLFGERSPGARDPRGLFSIKEPQERVLGAVRDRPAPGASALPVAAVLDQVRNAFTPASGYAATPQDGAINPVSLARLFPAQLSGVLPSSGVPGGGGGGSSSPATGNPAASPPGSAPAASDAPPAEDQAAEPSPDPLFPISETSPGKDIVPAPSLPGFASDIPPSVEKPSPNGDVFFPTRPETQTSAKPGGDTPRAIAIPEPAAWMFLLPGLLLLTSALRRDARARAAMARR